ncbi:MAG: SDR family oxidoreductase [Pseudomonadota bacterium]
MVDSETFGIGKRIALTLAEQGFFVYAGARKARDLEALSALPNIEGIRLDVTQQDEIDAAVATVRARDRGLYGLVNNAGVFLFDPLIEVSERDMEFIMDVNVLGPYRVTKAFAPLIIESEGRITTTGSVAGLFSTTLFGPYGMSKHAVEAYTDALAAEMAKFDVKVSIVEPGNFRSNIMQNMHRRLAQLDRGERESDFREEIARFASFAKADRSHHADPQPVADAVLDFLTSAQPAHRYLVTPNEREATLAISRSLAKLIELNQGHRFTKSRDELVAILDELLATKAAAR